MKTIVWDVDDVLNELMREWYENWWLPSHPGSAILFPAIVENPPHRILGVSLEEYQESLDLFRLNKGEKLKPVSEVLDWFQRYGSNCRHIALTSVPLTSADISAAWVFRHFGKWIRSFNTVPSQRQNNVIPIFDQTKKDFLEWWGKADIVIDDNQSTVTAASAIGLTTFLMPNPWNANKNTKLNMLKALSKLI